MTAGNAQFWFPLLLAVLAGLFTTVGGLISFFIRDLKKSYLQFALGLSAGVMVYVSFAELLAAAVRQIGFLRANAAFFGGMLLVMLLDFFIPHEYIEERTGTAARDTRLMKAGIFTALGIAIHNFPEGAAVFMSALVNLKLGVAMAVAIALHNIPEGMAVAMPIFYATGNRRKALWYAFVSGIAEPAGAVIALLLLAPFLGTTALSFSLALVAGIMVFISFDELLPLSYEGEGYHVSILGVVLGMLVMAVSLQLL